MSVRKQLLIRDKGDIVGEEELVARIEQAVRDIIDTDPDETIKLHNLLCQGEVDFYETEGGEPLDTDGKLGQPHSEWAYVFTKGEDG